jgi:hypothetical protein
MDLWSYLENGGKRAVAVAHRRWGKDEIGLHWTAVSALTKPAVYWHMLPIGTQARKAIWTAVNPHTGKRRIDEAFPHEIRENTNDQEMFIRFKTGSTWQVVGSDNYNALVGSPPYGLVFSEWSLADPSAWAYLSPILQENGGWALFIYTARGKNHGYSVYKTAQRTDGWYAILQTADDTGVFSPGELEAARQEYISIYGEDEGSAVFQQEYHCSFDAAIMGAYYGKEITRLEKEKRIIKVPYDPTLPVHTAWDLGLDDATAIWFVQIGGYEVRVIDYYEVNNQSLTDTARYLTNQKPYQYAAHYLPHDVRIRELTSGMSRQQTLMSLGFRNVIPGAQMKVEDGINAARNLLVKCVFDEQKTERGLDCLRQYRREWDNAARTYRQKPLHDWTSHGADAFRELAVNLNPNWLPEDEFEEYANPAQLGRSSVTGY